uniref:Insulin-like domain-containing protein n=1 Tax=Sinocyclocheilus anshuiensis TaxID=1608454 RepID=A0A671S8B8_9TELE
RNSSHLNEKTIQFYLTNHAELIRKRGIVEQCCHKPCSIFELQNYCN